MEQILVLGAGRIGKGVFESEAAGNLERISRLNPSGSVSESFWVPALVEGLVEQTVPARGILGDLEGAEVCQSSWRPGLESPCSIMVVTNALFS